MRVAFAAAVLAVAGLAIAGTRAIRAQEVPPLSSHVNDYADMIGADAQQAIDDRLAKLEADTGAQVVVLTVPSLEGGSLEEFTLRIAETWKLGREDTDDGLIIFVARDDRMIRLEVGYGLEGTVPDALANRIIDERMAPAFRNGDFEGGIASAAEAVEILVRGENLPPPAISEPQGDLAGALIGTLVLMSVLAGFLPRILAVLLYVLTAPLIAVVTYGTLGAVPAVFLTGLWLVGFPVLRFLMRRIDWSQMSGPGGGVWHSGGGSSGGGWGGGFSGGGGSFGGGGASGGW